MAFPGIIGFLMNYADVIPMSNNVHGMQRDFSAVIEELLNKKEYVLIYPEQEMCKADYELKKAAYERVYGKPLSYAFDKTDIAGWTGENDEQ